MDSYQGFASRKLCAEVGQAMAMAMAMATSPSSTPSPFLDADAASPSTTKSDMKPITAVAVVFFFTAFLLVAFFCIHFQRYCSLRHARTVLYDRPTHGLDGSFLETLPKVTFSSSSVLQTEEKEKEKDKEKGKEAMATETATATECAICLEEFSEQETLVRLPHCGHSFHLECVSLWLFSHTDCPLCRHSLLPHPDNGNNCNGSDNGNCNDSDSGNSNGNGNDNRNGSSNGSDNRNANAIAIAIASSPSSL